MHIDLLAGLLRCRVNSVQGFRTLVLRFMELDQEQQQVVVQLASSLALDAYGKEKEAAALEHLFTKGNPGITLIVAQGREILGMANVREEQVWDYDLTFSVNMMVGSRAQGRGVGTFLHRELVRLTNPAVYGRYTQNPVVRLILGKAFPEDRTFPEVGKDVPVGIQSLAQEVFQVLGSSSEFDQATMVRQGGRSYRQGVTAKKIQCGDPELDEFFSALWPNKNVMLLTVFEFSLL